LICNLAVDATQKESNKKERKRSTKAPYLFILRTKMFTSTPEIVDKIKRINY
jgi:hypothetical protein